MGKFGKGKMKYVNWQLWKSEIVFIQSVGIAIMYSILCFNWLDIFIDKLTTIKKRILKSKHEWATNSLRLLVVHIPLKANYHTVSIMIFAILYGTQRIWIHFHKYKIIVYVNILYIQFVLILNCYKNINTVISKVKAQLVISPGIK